MIDEARLSGLLFRWQAEQDFGRDVPAAELCPDNPDLAADLAHRIAVLRAVRAFATRFRCGQVPPTIAGS